MLSIFLSLQWRACVRTMELGPGPSVSRWIHAPATELQTSLLVMVVTPGSSFRKSTWGSIRLTTITMLTSPERLFRKSTWGSIRLTTITMLYPLTQPKGLPKTAMIKVTVLRIINSSIIPFIMSTMLNNSYIVLARCTANI